MVAIDVKTGKLAFQAKIPKAFRPSLRSASTRARLSLAA
jgi:hypothetical protein